MKKNTQFDVVALGEMLIDFTETGFSNQGNPLLEANPGGAPCNVLAILTKLGYKTSFIGKVGDDIFGNQLEEAIRKVGINTAGLIKDKKQNTTLAFVHNDPDGDRSFSFYRNPGADMMLAEDELNKELLENTKIFHFGSLSLTNEPCRTATKKAIEIAKSNQAIISFDPNLRELLWENLDIAKEQIHYGMNQCDILKISDNELVWFTGFEEYQEGIKYLQNHYPNIKLILFSLGKDGSMGITRKVSVKQSAFLAMKAIDTTGAGDTFYGTCLSFIIKYLQDDVSLENLSENQLIEMLRFANGAAAIITTKKGALMVMPSKSDVENLIEK